MLRKKEGSIEWLEFEILQDVPGLVHGTFLRHGGVSAHPPGSLNASENTAADAPLVAENFRRMMQALKIPQYHSAYQVHGNNLTWVQEIGEPVRECDGLLTQIEDLALLIRHADCQATVFCDPLNRALAHVHCGWRGNVQNIYQKTVEMMARLFGSKPENLLVGVSPSLGPERAEFVNYQTELPDAFLPFQLRPFYFDLWAIARHQLEQSGILPHHIEIAGICTASNERDFFSYRRDKGTGVRCNHASFAMLTPKKPQKSADF